MCKTSAKRMIGIIIVLNNFTQTYDSISVVSWEYKYCINTIFIFPRRLLMCLTYLKYEYYHHHFSIVNAAFPLFFGTIRTPPPPPPVFYQTCLVFKFLRMHEISRLPNQFFIYILGVEIRFLINWAKLISWVNKMKFLFAFFLLFVQAVCWLF